MSDECQKMSCSLAQNSSLLLQETHASKPLVHSDASWTSGLLAVLVKQIHALLHNKLDCLFDTVINGSLAVTDAVESVAADVHSVATDVHTLQAQLLDDIGQLKDAADDTIELLQTNLRLARIFLIVMFVLHLLTALMVFGITIQKCRRKSNVVSMKTPRDVARPRRMQGA